MKINDFSNLEKCIIISSIIFVFSLPAIISLHYFPSPFNEASSWLGSAFGGITAPFVGILNAILLYITIKLQIQTNSNSETRQLKSDQSQVLQLYYQSLRSSIDNYSYRNSSDIIYTGSEGIYHFLNDFYCNPHRFVEEINTNSRITELKSVLEIFDIVLLNVEESTSTDKHAIFNLTKHQFMYRVFPRLNMPEIVKENFCKTYCEDCKQEHGLPGDFINLLTKIRSKLE